MQQVLTTADVPPRDRLAYWHDVSSRVFVGHECHIRNAAAFDATVLHAPLGQIGIVDIASTGLNEAGRVPRSFAHGEEHDFYLCLQLSGTTGVNQDGRDAIIGPGDFHLQDTRRPYWSRYSETWRQLIVQIPRRALVARLASTSQLTARPVSYANNMGGLVSDYLRMVHARIDTLQDDERAHVGDQVLDLIAMVLAAHAAGDDLPKLSSARSVAMLQLRTAIEQRLDDPALNPETAASAAGISVRYANALLAEEGLSLQRLIVLRRLERCRLALEDPGQAHRTIGDIAYGWGFSDLSHFSRRFKRAFGRAPGDYRRQQSG